MFQKERLENNKRGFYTGGWNIFMHCLDREIYEHIQITCQNSKFQLRSAYAIAKLTKTGYSKNKFYIEALKLYKEVCTCTVGCDSYSDFFFFANYLELTTHGFHQTNIMMANGDQKTIMKNLTERMLFSVSFPTKWSSVFSIIRDCGQVLFNVWFLFQCRQALKNEIRQREAMWGTVYGKMVEAVIKIKTLQARLVSVYTIQLLNLKQQANHCFLFFFILFDNSLDTGRTSIKLSYSWHLSFWQSRSVLLLIHQFVSIAFEAVLSSGDWFCLQKFEAYDSKGSVVAVDKKKEVKHTLILFFLFALQ